jgi:hypothetical protein
MKAIFEHFVWYDWDGFKFGATRFQGGVDHGGPRESIGPI